MKRSLIGTLLLALATPVLASWYPLFSPRQVRIAVGETTFANVRAMWSGITSYGPPNWTFNAADRDIATAHAEVTQTWQSVDFAITGVGPGQTYVLQGANGRVNGTVWVQIDVYCGVEPPIQAVEPRIETRLGEEVTLRTMSMIADRTTRVWYAGDVGDTSRPIPFNGTELAFTPETIGTHHYWVLATTPCSESRAGFEVIVRPAKRRSIR